MRLSSALFGLIRVGEGEKETADAFSLLHFPLWPQHSGSCHKSERLGSAHPVPIWHGSASFLRNTFRFQDVNKNQRILPVWLIHVKARRQYAMLFEFLSPIYSAQSTFSYVNPPPVSFWNVFYFQAGASFLKCCLPPLPRGLAMHL